MSTDAYNNYKSIFISNNRKWNLRDEVLGYCGLDCKLLYDIIKDFGLQIFLQFKINIDSSVSLPSLAFKIYRSNFMPVEDKIDPKTGKTMEDNTGYWTQISRQLNPSDWRMKNLIYGQFEIYPQGVRAGSSRVYNPRIS